MDYGTLIFSIIFGIWKAVLGIVEIHFIDTHRTTYVSFYARRKTFSINKREYAVVPSMVKNGKIYYKTSCSEPVKIDNVEMNKNQFYKYDIKEKVFNKIEYPIILEFSPEKTIYYVDSCEYFIKMRNNVIDRLMVSAEKALIQNIFYVACGCLIITLYIAYKVKEIGVI